MPPPKFGGAPVTNIRNRSSALARLAQARKPMPSHRCLVPFNSFAEYAPEPNPETKKKDVVWFAVNDARPLVASPVSRQSSKATGAPSPSRSPALVYGFLTTVPNAVVEPIHPKAMPVIPITEDERDIWMRAPWMRQRRCNGRCRITRCAGQKTARLCDVGLCHKNGCQRPNLSSLKGQ
jgi:putative SOS response-associated peptidase YedK